MVKSSKTVKRAKVTAPKAAAKAKSAPHTKAATRSRRDAPDAPRAPGRGKYDRTRSPDQRQKEQLHRLLEAAARVFAEKGYANATVEAIVSAAGMSRRTFYEHFEDLEGCLLTLHDKASRNVLKAVEAHVRAQPTPDGQTRAGVEAMLGGVAQFPALARVMFRELRAAGPQFEAQHQAMLERFAAMMHEGVAKAHAQGACSLPPDELRVFALVSGMEAVAMRYVMRGEEAKAMEAAPILVDMIQRTFA
ncbi:MAG: TetR/AcrR family transcriptional regulator [Myxococcales bacterium]|nr:TetR/AcrR family transcriptional regulator [Myxococcales bacterium]